MKGAAVFALLLATAYAAQDVLSYKGHAVLRVHTPHTAVAALMEFCDNQVLDVWNIDQSGEQALVDVHVEPEQKQAFVAECVRLNATLSDFIPDVGAMIVKNAASVSAFDDSNATDPFFDNYRRYADIRAKTQELASQRADATFIPSIGRTIDGRDIFAVRFGGRNPGPLGRRAVYLQGGIHAREWISPASVMFIMSQLLTTSDDAVLRLIDQLEFIIVPLLNADGYEWSHTNARLWRKNRRVNSGSTCIGVDLNRNWNDHWGGGGSSNNPCSETYRGTRHTSEPETEAVVNFLMQTVVRETTLIGGIDYHAYGQLILRPYGWQLPGQGVPENNVEMRDLGAAMRQAILSNSGMTYSNEHSAQLYVAAGGADDWFYSVATSRRLGFCIETRDTGRSGFILPPAQIRPTGGELYAATLVFANHALRRNN